MKIVSKNIKTTIIVGVSPLPTSNEPTKTKRSWKNEEKINWEKEMFRLQYVSKKVFKKI